MTESTNAKLLKAIDDESNEKLFNLSTKKIKEINLKILKELHLSNKDTLDILKKLNSYTYVDEMDDLKYGTYIRWVSLTNPSDLTLAKGAIFCEVTITDEGVQLICKNFGFGSKYFQIKLDENLVFQKLTSQELVLLSALDHLENNG